jgi:hypothetical protein
MAKRLKTTLGKKKNASLNITAQPTKTHKSTGTHGGKRRLKKSTSPAAHSGRRETGLGLWNRNIFTDPFFTDPFEDLFHMPSFENFMSTAKDLTKNALKRVKDIEKTTPVEGSNYSRSTYRTTSNVAGETKGELVSQESLINFDEKGRKFTEKRKTSENAKDRVMKTTHIKMIDNKGIKHMKRRNLDSGEEYEHNEYKNMNEKDLHKFNEEFRKGIKGGLAERRALANESMLPAIASSGLETDRDRYALALPGYGGDRLGMFNYGLANPWDRFGMLKDMMGGFGDIDRMFDRDRFGLGDFGRFSRDRDYGIGTPTSVGDHERNLFGKKAGMSSFDRSSEKGRAETTNAEHATTTRRGR